MAATDLRARILVIGAVARRLVGALELHSQLRDRAPQLGQRGILLLAAAGESRLHATKLGTQLCQR